MKAFNHPNVLPLLGVCVDCNDNDVFKIILPFMANGDLRSFLKSNRVELRNTDEFNTVCSCFVLCYTKDTRYSNRSCKQSYGCSNRKRCLLQFLLRISCIKTINSTISRAYENGCANNMSILTGRTIDNFCPFKASQSLVQTKPSFL